MRKKLLMAATAIPLVFGATATYAQSDNGPPPNSDPYGYYSQQDRDGYYDRNGRYVRYPERGLHEEDQGYDNGPPPDAYQQGVYEDKCRRSNNVAGTIFGAIAGGLIGSAVSHGHGHHGHGNDQGAAIAGGVILGGMLGNAMTRDMPCEDHPYAMRVYAQGLDGDIGRRYEWRHGDDYGYFTPGREFNRGGTMCRSFSETTYAHGRSYTRSGTACRMRDGNWRFD